MPLAANAAAIGPAPSLADVRARVRGKNINPDSLLATDYLNHFNEIIMLLGMIPDMPEFLEDAKAWKPKDYARHFRDSGFADKELAILAYEHAPPAFRQRFDQTVALMDELVTRGIRQIERCVGETDVLADVVRLLSERLQLLMDVAAALINGRHAVMAQAEIDRIMGSFDGGAAIEPSSSVEDAAG